MTPSIRFEKHGRNTVVLAEQSLPRPIDEVFAFFSDAANLEKITPPSVRFHILTPTPIGMEVGTLIDYKLRIKGLPIRWRTRISEWDPPHKFADEQLKGPYHLWYHTHWFKPDGDGTLIGDRIEYRPRGGPLINALFVKRDVKAIFTHRQQVLAEMFGGGGTS